MNTHDPNIEKTEADSENTHHALPLQATKKVPLQAWFLLVLAIALLGLNYYMNNTKPPVVKPQHETEEYTVDIPTNQASTSGEEIKPVANNENKNREAETKAEMQDLLERLNSPQGSSGEGSQMSGLNTRSEANVPGNAHVKPDEGDENHSPFTLSPEQAAKIADPADQNVLFLTRAATSKAERAQATGFGPLPLVIGQGKFIHGVLETAIDSDLPGQVRAVVTSDVFGEQGKVILIPKGSRLVGEYRSGLANNQSRLFVVWTRVLEPNGVDIPLGSEGTDNIGRAGLTGQVDYHFLARYGAAGMTSLLSAGVSTVGVNPTDQLNSASLYRQQVAEALAQQTNNLLTRDLNIPPTINIVQGTEIAVFVNKDLDFSKVFLG